MPSYKNSMTSQIVFMLAVAIVIMQLWNFYNTGEILDLFNTLVSWFIGAYLQRNIPHDNTGETKPVQAIDLDIKDIQDVG